ncbi:MAG: ABC transporter ATP-binding protein/permease [Defluviitaleaceae bacterium]|nr:ABC transporter ATP-binding protein/permease [Defluviitaleaceae bacterium]
MFYQEIQKVLTPIYKLRYLTLFLSAVSILMGLVPPYLMGILIDDITYYGGHRAYFIIGSLIGVLVLGFFLDWSQSLAWNNMINKGAGMVRSYLFENVLHKNYRFFIDHPIGDINNKVINDAYLYTQNKIAAMPTILLNFMHITVILVFLYHMDVYMTVAAMIFSVVFFAVCAYINKFLKKSSIKERKGFSALMNTANETLMGINTIQLYTVEDFFAHRFEKSVDKYEKLLIRLKLFQSLTTSATTSLIGIMTAFAVLSGIFFLSIERITVGGVVAFYLFLPRLSEPIRNLSNFNIEGQTAKAVAERLEELITKEVRPKTELEKIEHIEQLGFKNLGFRYPDTEEAVLSNINMELVRGDSVAVIGTSGTGKSTLLRLLKRQVDPTQGEILVNGKNHTTIDWHSYIDRIAVLTQQVFVFDATLQENISFGKKYPEKKIRESAEISMMGHFSMDEQAFGLSGGERQRIGLARAIACDYDVLILDEPTSELDSKTETKIIENLKALQQEKKFIMIVVTHSENVLNNLCNKRLEL